MMHQINDPVKNCVRSYAAGCPGLADVTMSPSASDEDPRCQWRGNCEQVDHFRHRIGQITDLVLNAQIIDEIHTNRRGDPHLVTTCLGSPAVQNIS